MQTSIINQYKTVSGNIQTYQATIMITGKAPIQGNQKNNIVSLKESKQEQFFEKGQPIRALSKNRVGLPPQPQRTRRNSKLIQAKQGLNSSMVQQNGRNNCIKTEVSEDVDNDEDSLIMNKHISNIKPYLKQRRHSLENEDQDLIEPQVVYPKFNQSFPRIKFPFKSITGFDLKAKLLVEEDQKFINSYWKQTFLTLKEQEDLSVLPNITKKQPHYRRLMRANFVNWMIQLFESYEKEEEHKLLFKTLSIIDRFLNNTEPLETKQYQLVGMCSFFLISKLQEVQAIPLYELYKYVGQKQYSIQQIIDMEARIMFELNIDFEVPTLFDFFELYYVMLQYHIQISGPFPSDTRRFLEDVSFLGREFAKLTLLDSQNLSMKPSVLGAVCLSYGLFVAETRNMGRLKNKEKLSEEQIRCICALWIKIQEALLEGYKPQDTDLLMIEISARLSYISFKAKDKLQCAFRNSDLMYLPEITEEMEMKYQKVI